MGSLGPAFSVIRQVACPEHPRDTPLETLGKINPVPSEAANNTEGGKQESLPWAPLLGHVLQSPEAGKGGTEENPSLARALEEGKKDF